ncbi:MAG: hypothetical protein OHK0029_32130 [Armatimonadaceae bacterium]
MNTEGTGRETRGIALIGCGGMASHYRGNYAAIPGTQYRLVVDVNAELARQVAQEHNVARFSTDWRDALADDIYIADISTPNHLHAEQAVALLEAGKHVIIQKPMAPTLAECRAIVAAAQASQRQAAVYMSDLEDPIVWDFREIVQGGYIGQVTGVRARYAHRGVLRAAGNAQSASYWRSSAEKTGGGAFIQLSLHHTNLLSWILDDQITSVMAYARNLMCPHIGGDDTTASVVEFGRTGAIGTFDAAWNAEGTTVEIYGSGGILRMRGGQGAAVEAQLSRPFSGRVVRVPDDRLTLILASGGMHEHCQSDNPLNQHIAFVEAVRDEKPYPITAEIGMYDVAVAKAVYGSSDEGRRIEISELLS